MSFAFLPLYTGDYLRDTVDLSPREHGAYLLMLMWCWQRAKPMPNDMLRIYRAAKAKDEEDEKAVRYVLAEFFVLGDDDCYHNKRLETELKRSNNLIERGKAGAAARWGKVNGHAKPDAKEMPDECLLDAKSMDPTPTPTTNPITTTNTKPTRTDPQILPSWLPLQSWNDWLGHRGASHGKFTKRAQELAIKTLDQLRLQGNDPVAVINRSIESGYKGLFPLEHKGRSKGQPGMDEWLRNQEVVDQGKLK